MCECLSTLSKGRLKNNSVTGLSLLGVGMSESASMPRVGLSFPTALMEIDMVMCFCVAARCICLHVYIL